MISQDATSAHTSYGFKCYGDVMMPNSINAEGEKVIKIAKCAKGGNFFLRLQKTFKNLKDTTNGRTAEDIA